LGYDLVRLHQQIDVAATGVVIRARAKQTHGGIGPIIDRTVSRMALRVDKLKRMTGV
jgi:hypothetical protein